MMNQQLLSKNMERECVILKPYISYEKLCKAHKIVPYLLKVYSQVYNLSEKDCREYYPLLAFIQALIYQADEEVEAAQVNGTSLSQPSLWNSKKEIIQSLLRELNLEHPTIENALERVGEFFDLENQLMASDTITHADVMRAAEWRSCDIRTLHCILIQMSGKPYRAEIFDIMLPREVLFEIADDIYSYRDDVASGKYNTYWMFERLYGESAPHYLKAEIERYRNLFEQRLKLFPKDEQKIYSERWQLLWQRNPFLSSAELLRAAALEAQWQEQS